MRVPVLRTELMPVWTLSPMITPSLRRPVSMRFPWRVTTTLRLSSRRLATFVPDPRLQPEPITESPT